MSGINNIINNNFAANPTLQRLLGVSQDREDFAKAVNGATASKYNDLAELQASGNAPVYNRALRDVVMKDVYATANTSVSNTLSYQASAVKEIRAIIDEFRGLLPTVNQNFPGAMTKNEACNRALAAIGKVLNTQDDEGLYVFGGVNSNTQPCGDLTAATNLDANGNILNIYTTATPNLKTITVADGYDVQVGLDASNQAFATLIGALNRFKASANPAPTAAELATLGTELNNGMLGIDSIETTIINNKTDLENATKSTEDKFIKASELLNSSKFVISTEELVQKMIDYARSAKILQSIQTLKNRTSDGLVDILNRISF